MSGYAYQWAKRQQVGDSSTKTLLKTYAHWAAEDYSTWVTNDEMIADTELDIKTIRKCRDKLIALGFLVETPQRKGDTRSIIVYQLLAPEGSVVVQSLDQRTGDTVLLSPPSLKEYEAKRDQKRSLSKSGASKGGQKRTPSESGAPPHLPQSPSTFTGKPLHISPEAPPDLDPKKGLGLPEVDGDSVAREPEPTARNDKAPDADRSQTAFERFWDAWPSTSGRKQARSICESHWLANGLDRSAELIIAHVQSMKLTKHWRTGGDPTPIRYLEQRRWLDGAPNVGASTVADDVTVDWWLGGTSIVEAQAERAGVPTRERETTPDLLIRVCAACGRGPWISHALQQARKDGEKRYQQVFSYFSDLDLLPPDYFV